MIRVKEKPAGVLITEQPANDDTGAGILVPFDELGTLAGELTGLALKLVLREGLRHALGTPSDARR